MSSTLASLCITEPQKERLSVQSKPTVLVVDDDPTQLNLLAQVLSEEYYSVLSAGSGRQALNVVAQAAEPPQLFLFDFDLGDMTGLELYDCLHACPLYEHIPAILVSCYLPQPEELQRRAITGIAKPYDLDVILARIATVISTTH